MPLAINRYDEHGVPASGNLGRFQYTGQMWIAEIGLYHFRARAYNPATGRFMQTDPIGIAGGANLYAYAGNDPVNGRDPSGLRSYRGVSLEATASCSGNCERGLDGDGGGARSRGDLNHTGVSVGVSFALNAILQNMGLSHSIAYSGLNPGWLRDPEDVARERDIPIRDVEDEIHEKRHWRRWECGATIYFSPDGSLRRSPLVTDRQECVCSACVEQATRIGPRNIVAIIHNHPSENRVIECPDAMWLGYLQDNNGLKEAGLSDRNILLRICVVTSLPILCAAGG